MSFRQNTVKSAYETETADRSAVSRGFLPVCREDMEELGIAQLDFVYVIGDAYVQTASRCWANRSLDFWYRPEIWIPW